MMKTKSLTGLALALAIAASAPAVMAAEKTTATTTEKTTTTTTVEKEAVLPGSIFTVVRDGANFSILTKAIQAAGLETTLGSKGSYTLFAPTDDAFTKLPDGVLATLLLPENKEKLRELLMYHVVAGAIPSATFVDGELKTSSAESVKVDVDGTNEPIEINDAKIVNADQTATNGIVHVVDKVLVPKSWDDFKALKK